MIKQIVSLALVALLLLMTGVLYADSSVLESLDKRDKFYDIAQFAGKTWFVGYPGQLLTTADEGKTFLKHEAPVKVGLFAMASFDETCALWSGADGLIMRTEDAGKTFSKIEVETKTPLFDITTVKGGNDAWAVGHFNTILHSADRGKTWKVQRYELPEDEVDEPGLNAVFFINATTGWIAGEFGTILRTVDGGKTWEKRPSPVSYLLFDIQFLDELRGIISGAEGSIYTTTDGGETWTQKKFPSTRHMYSFSLVGDRLHAVGQDSYYATGPLTGEGDWKVGRSGVYIWLNAIHFLSDKKAFAAGGRGTILRTDNGGKSWTQLSGR